MIWDAVIGCAAVDASGSWLRLHTADGAMRTIPWSAIQIAGFGGNHESQYTIEGVTEKTKSYFGTHDSLWIVYADGGFAQVMLEKLAPQRETIIAAFSTQLGDRWRGDQLTLIELMDVKTASAGKRPFPKLMIVMLAIMALTFLLPLVLILFFRQKPPQ